jgi:hypothetical protein
VGDDVPIDNDVFLMTDFMNLRIKSAHSFICVHRDMICICMLIEINIYTNMNIYVYTIFLKKHMCLCILAGSIGGSVRVVIIRTFLHLHAVRSWYNIFAVVVAHLHLFQFFCSSGRAFLSVKVTWQLRVRNMYHFFFRK